MNHLSLSEDMTLTQFRMELVKGKVLFDSMVGSLYKSMLFDDLTEGKEWFEELLVTRKGTPEFDCYSTFVLHNIFRQAQNDAYERMYIIMEEIYPELKGKAETGKFGYYLKCVVKKEG